MSETIYVEPECIHDNWGGRCIRCGARKRWVVEKPIDPLAACIGYGIEYQEAVDIVALALGGRDGLDELRQRLYDDAALRIGGDDE